MTNTYATAYNNIIPYGELSNISLHDISDFVKKEDKLKKEYLIGNIQRHIRDLVYEKNRVAKCYDFFNGKRDESEFQHLVDNYGIKHPRDIPFIPIMAKIIKALSNEQLQNALDYIVTCQNEEALDLKSQMRRDLLLQEIMTDFENYKTVAKKSEGSYADDLVKKLNAKYGQNWLADFEIAIHDFIEYIIDREDLKQKFNLAFQDLCVTGEMYLRTYVHELGRDPIVEICNPEDTWFDPSEDHAWLENCRRVVHRKWMTPGDILSNYGHLLHKDDKEHLDQMFYSYYYGHGDYGRSSREVLFDENNTLVYGTAYRKRKDLIAVYHVEWLSPDPVNKNTSNLDLVDVKRKNIQGERYELNRYEGYKIELGSNQNIFFGYGKSEYVERTVSNPYLCKLTYNGFLYRARNNNEPYSLVWATRDIQNMYDITHFQLNNLFAAAEPGGNIIPVEFIPKEYGNTPAERLTTAAAYRKLGLGQVVSISQEGLEGQYQFNNFGSYQSNLDGNLLSAFMQYLEILEEQAMNIVGLNRQLLGMIEERDGKAVTQTAVHQGSIINKDLYFINGLLIKKTLTHLANLARISYPYGNKLASVVVGGGNHKIFSLDARFNSIADYNVFIVDDLEDQQKIAKADELVMQGISQGIVNLKDAFNVILSKSISRKKQVLDDAYNQANQTAAQQLQQAQQQLQQYEQELQKLQKQLQTLTGAKDVDLKNKEIELKSQELKHKMEVDKKQLNLKEQEINDKRELEEKKIRTEQLQLIDNSPYNDKMNYTK